MSNKIRITTPGLTHHVMSRCIETKPLMRPVPVKKMGYRAIERAKKKYTFKLISYIFMDNHFHFIIQTIPGGASISRIMQYIKARIAEMYNKLMERTGPFWNERFKDVIIEKQAHPAYYFFWLIWYLAFNPVRARLCRDPVTYPYSSIRYYLYEDADIDVPVTWHQFFYELGNTFAERVNRFLTFEEAYRKRVFDCF